MNNLVKCKYCNQNLTTQGVCSFRKNESDICQLICVPCNATFWFEKFLDQKSPILIRAQIKCNFKTQEAVIDFLYSENKSIITLCNVPIYKKLYPKPCVKLLKEFYLEVNGIPHITPNNFLEKLQTYMIFS
jgi:hypothetical protein